MRFVQRSVGEEFTKRVSTLKNASADDASGRLASILVWLEHEPITRVALAKLRAGVDRNKVFPETRQSMARPPAYTTEEIAFVGLTLMENSRDQNADFPNLCVAVGIDPGNVDLMLAQGFRDYIYPFLEFIAQEVDAAAEQTSTEGVLEMRMTDILTGELRELTPKTAAALSEVAKEFGSSSEGTKWQNVGNSCRHILKAFIAELSLTRRVTAPDDVQTGNFKELSRRLVKEGDSRGTAAKLVEAVWNHAQSVTHRPLTTKDEALRVFVWTCLSVSEIVRASSGEA